MALKGIPYNLNEAAKALGKSTATVSYWLSKGELEEIPTRGHGRLITAASVEAKARELGVEIKEVAEAGESA